jgi:hypothetical protein
MEILFVRGNSLVSRAIIFLTQEPISHVAIKYGDQVFHTNFIGSHILSYSDFCKKYATIYTVNYAIDVELLDQKIATHKNKPYDFLALAYLGIRYAAKKYLKIPLPKVNLWAISGMYNCVELVSELAYNKEDSLLTPYRLYLKLSNG